MFKKRLKVVGKCLLWIIVAMVVFLLVERIRGQLALANFKRGLIAKGDQSRPQNSKSSSPALWTRRDYVWPAPATAEEVWDYRKESLKN
jgi:hypothetical protein